MTFAWHIAKKDFRLQRPVIAGWIALSLINVANRLVAPLLAQDPRWEHTFLPPWVFITAVGYILVLFVSIASLIQADRVVGTTAFWLTRPIPPGTLLRGKLLGLFLFVIVPALVIDAMVMAAFHVSATTIAAALLQEAWTLAVFMLAIVFGAAVTSTLLRLLLIIIGTFVAIYFWTTLTFILSVPVASADPPAGWNLPRLFYDPTPLVIGLTTFASGVLIAIGYQYWQRRRVPAVAIFIAGVVVTWLTLGLWSHTSLFGGEPTLASQAWARDPAITHARLRTVDRVTGHPLPPSATLLETNGEKEVIGPIVLDGLPPGYVAAPFTLDAKLELADGSSLSSSRLDYARHVTLQPGDTGSDPNGLTRTEYWSTLIHVSDQAFREHGPQPGVYTGTFYFGIERHETLATMPLTVGATYNDGVRSIVVSGLQHEHDDKAGCVVSLRATSVDLLGHSLGHPELAVRYRRRDGTELADPSAPTRPAPQGRRAASRYDAIPASLLHTFEVERREAYPVPMSGPNLSVGPPCEDITIEVERVTYAGHLTRTVVVRDFQLNDPFAGTAAR